MRITVVVCCGLRFARHKDRLVLTSWIGLLRIENAWPALNALSISRILDLTNWHFHVEFSNATAGRDSHTSRAIIL